MNDTLARIVADFDAAILLELKQGGGEIDLVRVRDAADDRLRALKDGADAEQFEAIIAAALEIGTKLDMALAAIE